MTSCVFWKWVNTFVTSCNRVKLLEIAWRSCNYYENLSLKAVYFWVINKGFACHSLFQIILLGIFTSFSVTNRKKMKKHKKKGKNTKVVYQGLGATPKHWQIPNNWLTSGKNILSQIQRVSINMNMLLFNK